jgi:hypothetical protein
MKIADCHDLPVEIDLRAAGRSQIFQGMAELADQGERE